MTRTPSQSRRRKRSTWNRLQWNCSPRTTILVLPTLLARTTMVLVRNIAACPLAEHSSGRGVVKYMEKNPTRLPCWGIAVDTSDGRPLGYVAVTLHPMQPMDGLHTTKPGGIYRPVDGEFERTRERHRHQTSGVGGGSGPATRR